MAAANPIDLLFGGMEKLGPGCDEETLRMLRRLPRDRFDVVIDARCGAGRQTMALVGRSAEASVDHLVRVHCLDMRDIASRFHRRLRGRE